MPKYSIDFKLWGTAYIEADSEEDARQLFVAACGTEPMPTPLTLACADIESDVDGVVFSPEFTAYGSDEELEVWEDD